MKGSADDLLARTRCFSCGELGHFSRDCPASSTTATPQQSRSTFIVSQGPNHGGTSRTFMTAANPAPLRTIAVYAGVRAAAGEGLVDSAAEDAVIGSGAFQRLRAILAQQGLQPRPVKGPSGACAGIGGSATVSSMWDVPVGIVKTNGLLRMTEVEDRDGFETPLLIPVSFQELVGMVIDYDAAEVRNRQGKSTPMHRLPTGHRAVSVVEFDGPWSLPKELMVQGRDPFQLPRLSKPHPRNSPLGQTKGVAVWLRYSDGTFEQKAWLEGPRKNLVLPSECFSANEACSLDSSRVTYLDATPDMNESWTQIGQARLSFSRLAQSSAQPLPRPLRTPRLLLLLLLPLLRARRLRSQFSMVQCRCAQWVLHQCLTCPTQQSQCKLVQPSMISRVFFSLLRFWGVVALLVVLMLGRCCRHHGEFCEPNGISFSCS